MATTPPKRSYQSAESRRTGPDERSVSARATDGAPEHLNLLRDDHAREILTVLADGPRYGRELAEMCGVSRATIYRRLNRLEAAGFVTTELCPDPDGHHRKEFHLLRDRFTVAVKDGAIAVTASQSNGRATPNQPVSPNEE